MDCKRTYHFLGGGKRGGYHGNQYLVHERQPLSFLAIGFLRIWWNLNILAKDCGIPYQEFTFIQVPSDSLVITR